MHIVFWCFRPHPVQLLAVVYLPDKLRHNSYAQMYLSVGVSRRSKVLVCALKKGHQHWRSLPRQVFGMLGSQLCLSFSAGSSFSERLQPPWAQEEYSRQHPIGACHQDLSHTWLTYLLKPVTCLSARTPQGDLSLFFLLVGARSYSVELSR